MLGLDTNILLRLLTQDDPKQLAQAKGFIAGNCTPDDPGFINRTAVLEVVWVLESLYEEYSREQIANAVESLLDAAMLTIEDSTAVRAAVEGYRDGLDFADALIAIINAERGCTATATFDSGAVKKNGHFVLVE